jgi:hypothetical protein
MYPRVELEAVDLSPFRVGNTGIDYVWSFASAAPGPHVVLCALIHGRHAVNSLLFSPTSSPIKVSTAPIPLPRVISKRT